MGIKFVVNSPKEIMLIIIVESFFALFLGDGGKNGI